MTRTAHRIEPPPGGHETWQAYVLTHACQVLEQVRRRPGRIATFTEDEYDTWRAAMRIHRDAWRAHEARAAANLVTAVEAVETQGRAAGWWVDTHIPHTPTIPLIDPNEAADILTHLDPEGGEAWAWALAKACRHRRQRSA